MLQFKPVFLGQAPRAVARATTTQKCVRTNDIENVGVTKRHHTFFEMLGNFSFGDYFKKDAIRWAWQLATSEFGLPADRVWVSVFEKDEEALALWRDDVGVPTARIQRLGAKDNFWAAGPTGPCGPCSELYYDFHPERGLEGASLEDDTRFIEFYNLVFMESNRDAAGVLTPLAAPCIDTGMGLERMAQILQRVPNNYETDLLFPIVSEAAAMAGIEYDAASEAQRTRLKVLADHVRAVTYLLSDGVLPSNVGRGYVVRRLVRRAVRAGRLLGCVARAGDASSPCFTPALARVAISLSPGCDPGVARNSARICAELEREEARFGATLARGEALLSSQIDAALASPLPDGRCVLPGAAAFLLYDTFGFPLEITIEAAAERCVSVDTAGFEAAMASARALSQAAVVGINVTTGDDVAALAATHGDTRFVGYTSLESPARLLALRVGGVEVPSAEAGEAVEVLLDATPFYAAGGGQAGDSGVISQHGVSVRVTDTVRAAGGRLIFHRGVVEGDGRMEAGGTPATASVDASSRRRAAAHHTATHLLHAALRETLGSGVGQAGSAVDAARLRFDFTSDSPPSPEQLRAIEARVNGWVSDAAGVATREVPLAEARASGAVAMFGEKYGNVVRVVDVPGVSMELCGGTHVGNTSQVGAFKARGASLRTVPCSELLWTNIHHPPPFPPSFPRSCPRGASRRACAASKRWRDPRRWSCCNSAMARCAPSRLRSKCSPTRWRRGWAPWRTRRAGWRRRWRA